MNVVPWDGQTSDNSDEMQGKGWLPKGLEPCTLTKTTRESSAPYSWSRNTTANSESRPVVSGASFSRQCSSASWCSELPTDGQPTPQKEKSGEFSFAGLSSPEAGSDAQAVKLIPTHRAGAQLRRAAAAQREVKVQPVPAELLQKAVNSAVASSDFRCTAAIGCENPELCMVSASYEQMTGYRRKELLGKNPRFLSHGLCVDVEQLSRVRSAVETGLPATACLLNRRKTGELFLNLMHVRGLSVGVDAQTGQDLWFFLSVHCDVTDDACGMTDGTALEEQGLKLAEAAEQIRGEINAYIYGVFRVASGIYNTKQPAPSPGGLCCRPKASSAWRGGPNSRCMPGTVPLNWRLQDKLEENEDCSWSTGLQLLHAVVGATAAGLAPMLLFTVLRRK